MSANSSPDVRPALPGSANATATWIELERHMIAMLAHGAGLSEILEEVARCVELALPGHHVSIMRRSRSANELLLEVGPTLPREYAEAVARVPIGPDIGSCGSAAFLRRRVVVEDIAVDPRWAGWRDLALRAGLRACWSQPIIGSSGDLLGAFALYLQTPGGPSADEVDHIEIAAHLVGLAIERNEAESQRRLRDAIVNELTDSVIVFDRDLRIVECNPATERMWGYTRAELLGKTPAFFYPRADQPEQVANEVVATVRRDGRWDGERPFETKSGRVGVRDVTVLLLKDPAGREFGFLAINRDVTAQRRAEVEREELRGKMLQTQKLESLGILAGGIAHDFNNLLTGILGNAELALDNAGLGAHTRTALLAIQRSADRAADLTRQMLAYSGRAAFELSVTELSAEVREIGSLLGSSIAKKVDLRFELAPNLPPIEADRAQLQQLTMNLVINAAEAIGDEPGEVVVSTWAWTNGSVELDVQYPTDGLPPGRYAVLEVRDNGCGMDAETLRLIFDPFFTTKFTGRGLGLAAVIGIVRAHYGGLKVSSEVGRGTVFRVYLPFSTKERTSDDAGALGQLATRATVLVIDDEPVVTDLVATSLELFGHRVFVALSGEQGLAIFEAHADEIDVVLLDVTMPRLGAREILDALRRRRQDVRVVLSSGYAEAEVARQFAQGEFEGFIQKPYSPQTLQDGLRRALEKR
ncbi:MAG: response regulator [Planctomycetes bacterium]|nr:response regulator [Planctomycetota bacterium]